MIQRLWRPGPVHLAAPLRNCSIVLSPRKRQRCPVFTTAPDPLARYSKIPPVTSADQFAMDINTWLTLHTAQQTDPAAVFGSCQTAFDRLIAKLGSHGRPLASVKRGFDELLHELDFATSGFASESRAREASSDQISKQQEAARSQSSEKVARLQSLVGLVRSLRDDLSEENRELQADIRRLRDAATNLEITNTAQRDAMDDIRDEIDGIRDRRRAAVEKFARHNEKMQITKQTIDAEFAQISEILARLYQIVSAQKEVGHRIGAVRAELADAETRNAANRDEEAIAEETLRELRADVERLRHAVAQTEAENRAMEAAREVVREREKALANNG
jgi:chromosome segregation ATPase